MILFLLIKIIVNFNHLKFNYKTLISIKTYNCAEIWLDYESLIRSN